MDEKARATYVLAAATVTAAMMRGHQHNNITAVDLLDDIIRQMEIRGLIPEGVTEADTE